MQSTENYKQEEQQHPIIQLHMKKMKMLHLCLCKCIHISEVFKRIWTVQCSYLKHKTKNITTPIIFNNYYIHLEHLRWTVLFYVCRRFKAHIIWQTHSPEINDSLVLMGCVKHKSSNTRTNTALQNTVGWLETACQDALDFYYFGIGYNFVWQTAGGEERGRKQLFC